MPVEFLLNTMQGVASSKFQYWYKHPESRERPWFEISGAAGTGKTTVVKHIIKELGLQDNEVIFMAFVGKAALALRLSGVNGKTIHSVIYRLIKRYKKDAETGEEKNNKKNYFKKNFRKWENSGVGSKK